MNNKMTDIIKTIQESVEVEASKRVTCGGEFNFKAGCEYLMPIIEKLIEQRNVSIQDQGDDFHWQSVYDELDKKIVELLTKGK